MLNCFFQPRPQGRLAAWATTKTEVLCRDPRKMGVSPILASNGVESPVNLGSFFGSYRQHGRDARDTDEHRNRARQKRKQNRPADGEQRGVGILEMIVNL